MKEAFEYNGLWWLPNKPDNKVCGILKFVPKKEILLDLTGTLENSDEDFNRATLIDVIHGLTSDGKEITLHRCFEIKRSFGSGFPISSYDCDIILVGAHYNSYTNIVFKEMYINYSNLDQWININGFDIQIRPGGESIIKYKKPNKIKALINRDLHLGIAFSSKGPNENIVQRETRIEQTAYIGIRFSEQKHLSEFKNINFIIHNFLSLAIGVPVHPLSIIGYASENNSEQVMIFYRSLDSPRTSEIINPYKMLFTFEDISTRFEDFLSNWINKAELLSPVCNLYFGIEYSSQMYLELQFLSIMQALESYHRRIMNHPEIPEHEFERKIKEILDSAPEDYKSWLKYKLAHSNQPHLRIRLNDLYERFEIIMNGFVANKDDFITNSVNTRNYLTHYNPELKNKSVKGEELLFIINKLKLMTELCLLAEIGFSLNDMNRMYSKYEKKRKYNIEKIN